MRTGTTVKRAFSSDDSPFRIDKWNETELPNMQNIRQKLHVLNKKDKRKIVTRTIV